MCLGLILVRVTQRLEPRNCTPRASDLNGHNVLILYMLLRTHRHGKWQVYTRRARYCHSASGRKGLGKLFAVLGCTWIENGSLARWRAAPLYTQEPSLGLRPSLDAVTATLSSTGVDIWGSRWHPRLFLTLPMTTRSIIILSSSSGMW